jgi:hypothetical protein
MSSLLKNLIIFLTLVALGGLGYYLFFNGGSDDIVSTSGSNNVSSQAAFQTREFKSILSDLESVDLDTSLLQDSNFLQLKDHSQLVSERPYGRTNPFSANQ